MLFPPTGYDSHPIVKQLGKFKDTIGNITAIPLNTEKLKILQFGNITLMDSAAFIPHSLEKMTETLKKSQHSFPILQQWDKAQGQMDLLLRKGVYPYEYVTSLQVLKDTTSLPPKSAFHSRLNDADITDEDYEHAQKVWDHFGCKNLLDYTKLYNLSDVYLLAESMMHFREWVFSKFQLDFAHYLSLPMLGKDIMLKMTKEQPQYLHDPEMVQMLKSNIRGGVSYINTRMLDVTKADNESIIYLDANNLYGKAMKYAMPYGDYEWMSRKECDEFDVKTMVDDSKEIGYILEVDLRYPKKLHRAHNSFPLAPENIEITDKDLSPYSLECHAKIHGKGKHRAKKLTSTFRDRKNYVLHGQNLQLYLELGMELVHIHRAIKFKQKPFVAPYIDFCMRERQKAKTSAEKDNMKLLSNSLYGKVSET